MPLDLIVLCIRLVSMTMSLRHQVQTHRYVAFDRPFWGTEDEEKCMIPLPQPAMSNYKLMHAVGKNISRCRKRRRGRRNPRKIAEVCAFPRIRPR